MKIAHIVPPKFLRHFEDLLGEYHLILPQIVLADKEYQQFYRRKSREGHMVILDNGAYEFGKPLSSDEMLKAIELSEPSEIVLDDHIGSDADFSYKRTVGSAEFYRSVGIEVGLMAVPQTVKLSLLPTLIKDLSEIEGVTTIGIPKSLTSDSDGRGSILETLDEIFLGWGLKMPEVHLLGSRCSGEFQDGRVLNVVRGADTSSIFRMSACLFGSRPKDYFDRSLKLPISIEGARIRFQNELNRRQFQRREIEL